MSLFKFRITMRHDRGEAAITIFARDIQSAINIVLTAEKAPERCIFDCTSGPSLSAIFPDKQR